MTPAELLLDMRAAHEARKAYQRAAEVLSARAVHAFRAHDFEAAKHLAALANTVQRAARAEYEESQR